MSILLAAVTGSGGGALLNSSSFFCISDSWFAVMLFPGFQIPAGRRSRRSGVEDWPRLGLCACCPCAAVRM